MYFISRVYLFCALPLICVWRFLFYFIFIYFGFDLHHIYGAVDRAHVCVSWRVYWDRNDKQKWRYFNKMWIKISFTIVLLLCSGWLTYFVFKFGQCCMHARVECDRSKKARNSNKMESKSEKCNGFATGRRRLPLFGTDTVVVVTSCDAMRSTVAPFALISTWKVFSSWTLFLMGDSSAWKLFLSLLRNRFICAKYV